MAHQFGIVPTLLCSTLQKFFTEKRSDYVSMDIIMLWHQLDLKLQRYGTIEVCVIIIIILSLFWLAPAIFV